MSRHAILEKMRDSYRAGDIKGLKRQFAISQWLLTDEDKVKIAKAITELESRPPKEPLHPLVAHALKVLGGRIISND